MTRAAVAQHAERGVDLIKVMASGGFVTMGTDQLGAQFTVAQLAALVDAAFCHRPPGRGARPLAY